MSERVNAHMQAAELFLLQIQLNKISLAEVVVLTAIAQRLDVSAGWSPPKNTRHVQHNACSTTLCPKKLSAGVLISPTL
jgi:hypothetical protein